MSGGAVSRENVDIVQRVWEAWDRRDMEALFALYDPAIVWESHTGPIELAGAYRGHAGIRDVFRQWLEPFETFAVHAETFIDAGDSVVVGWRQSGRGKVSGAEVEVPGWQVCKIRCGLVIRVDLFGTKAEALEAAGLRE
jgi:ketosteroid isomerase-like protein